MYVAFVAKVVRVKSTDKSEDNLRGKVTLLSMKRLPDFQRLMPSNKTMVEHYREQMLINQGKNPHEVEIKAYEVEVSVEDFNRLTAILRQKLGTKDYLLNYIPIVYDSKSPVWIKIVMPPKPIQVEDPIRGQHPDMVFTDVDLIKEEKAITAEGCSEPFIGIDKASGEDFSVISVVEMSDVTPDNLVVDEPWDIEHKKK